MLRSIILLAFSLIYIALFSQDISENTDSSYYYKQKTKEYIGKERPLKFSNPNKMIMFDSVKYFYSKSPDDTLLFNINLIEIKRQQYIHKNYDSIKQLCLNNIEVSKRIGSSLGMKGLNISYNKIATIFSMNGDNDSLIKYTSINYNLTSNYARTLDTISDYYYDKLARILQRMSQGYTAKHNYNLALYLNLKALDLDKLTKDNNRLRKIHLSIGSIYTKIGDYRSALNYFNKSLEYYNLTPDKDRYPPFITYTNIGSVYIHLNQYDTALYYTNLAIKQRLINDHYTSTLAFARLYNNKAVCHRHLEQNDSAMVYFEKSLKYFELSKVDNDIVSVKTNIATAYIDMGKYNEAEAILNKQIKVINRDEYSLTKMEIYNGLSVIYENTQRPKKALKYKKISYSIKDSINSDDVKNKMNEYKERYEAEIKEKDIIRLQRENRFQELENEKEKALKENQKLISLILVILLATLIAILFILRRNNKLTRISDQEKFARKEKEKNQKILDLVKNQEVNSINSFIEGQDKERNRIAAELHDRLGSLLSTVKLHFSSFEPEINEGDSRESFKFAIDLLDNSVSEVRSISHNLSKGMITEFGLSKEIENLRDTINNAGVIDVKYIIMGDNVSINPDRAIEIFRIIQEVVTNAIKHSHSDEIFIQQINNDDEISITIEDYGVGFDMTKIKNSGMGLSNLQNRANKIGASCIVESTEGQGTTITLELSKQKTTK